MNGAIYYEDWSNIQQQVAPPCGYKFTTNAGKACQANSSAATLRALWVWSNTASEGATRPSQLPRRLIV